MPTPPARVLAIDDEEVGRVALRAQLG